MSNPVDVRGVMAGQDPILTADYTNLELRVLAEAIEPPPKKKKKRKPKKTASGLKELKTILKYRLSEILEAVRADPDAGVMRREAAAKVLNHIKKTPDKDLFYRLERFPVDIPMAFGMHAPYCGKRPASGVSALDVEVRGCSLAKRYGIKRVDVSKRA